MLILYQEVVSFHKYTTYICEYFRVSDFPFVTGTLQRLVGHQAPVISLDWNPFSEHMIASGAKDGAIKLWDTRKGGPRALLATFDWRQEQAVVFDDTKWKKDWKRDETVRGHEGGISSVCNLVSTGNLTSFVFFSFFYRRGCYVYALHRLRATSPLRGQRPTPAALESHAESVRSEWITEFLFLFHDRVFVNLEIQ